jgi:ubiquinone/menaquinone biosynthesis C-methylase UbiE
VTDERVAAQAAVGFDRAASTYDRRRPGYPPALVARVADRIGAAPGRRVLDLGAGTGKLTRELVAIGCQVVALEPLAAMRTQLTIATPGVEVLDGTAEAVPLPDDSVDAVTSAQAFHWFDTARALDEIARVLRPGGGLALFWNERSTDGGWMHEFETLADDLAQNPHVYPGDAWEAVLDADPRFTPRQVDRANVEERVSPEWLLENVTTKSWLASKAPTERDAIVAALTEFLATNPETAGRAELVFHRPCMAHWCRLTP